MDIKNPHHPQWKPPFCPNPNCKFHRELHQGWHFKRIGFYRRQTHPRRIQRFLCLHCRRSFSTQTFRTDYWLRRPDILPELMTLICGCMAIRQVARHFGVSPKTIARQLARLGRHCLLFHLRQMKDLPPPRDITIDGFESFELSQYYPFHHHLAVDSNTGFFLWFTDSPLRRKGRMTPYQKKRRAELENRFGRPDPQAVRKDMRELLEVVTANSDRITIRSDEHKSYPAAMRGLAVEIEHRVTNSRQRRDKRNELWEVNLTDLLIRHSSANHKRETIAWSKRRQSSALRLGVFLVWRNYVNRRWAKRGRASPAMELGVCTKQETAGEVLKERYFPHREGLSGRWGQYYWGEVETPALGRNLRHELKYAA